ncbi:MAG: M20/M25/M40 family metallo-hydrolase [Alphaproteobacteria bacterium]|nr:M20/M25/M40 family metallo-hydrolase [Alphaproteobacteria bacterium]
MKNDLAGRAKEIALKLTSWPSITGTADEAGFAEKLTDLLKGFDHVWTEKIAGDAARRSNVFAIKRGRSPKTIVLTGHFDVVSIEDFGVLKHLAFDCEILLPALISKLRATGENAGALTDFESGDFLPGRGLLDMKAGLAAGIAAIESYKGDATLLFVAVSDEEERSAGARAAAPLLKSIAAEHKLDIQLVVNLDAISDQGDGSSGRVITYGSIGKQLITAFVVGKQTHAGYPQDGVNAAYVAAELVTEFELAKDLSETTGAEVAAPPTALYAKDLKQGYNVTTPAQTFVYWNTMQHQRSPDQVFELIMAHARRAVDRAAQRTGHAIDLITYAALETLAGRKPSPRDARLDLPEQSRLATLEIVEAVHLANPTVIIGFGSIPYPAVLMRDQKLRATIEQAVLPFGIGSVNYFAGISDMSFFGEASGDLSLVAANAPIWGTGFTMPDAAGYPCINLGPWGRDYHQRLERLHAPYAFEVLPRALLAVIEAVVKLG